MSKMVMGRGAGRFAGGGGGISLAVQRPPLSLQRPEKSGMCSFLALGFVLLLLARAAGQVALKTFDGAVPGDHLGWSVGGAGDVNGDGFADLVVGLPEDATHGLSSGGAQVLSGLDGALLFAFHGDSAGDGFGRAVAGAGDVNGDGFADLIVGAFGDDNNGLGSGSARVFSGLDGTTLFTFNGSGSLDKFGASVAGAGDVNGDGFGDLIVGAPRSPLPSAPAGSASVFSGADGTLLHVFQGTSAGELFGTSVAGAGDVDGDGFADLIVGAPYANNNGTNSGRAQIFSGVDGALLFTFDGLAAFDFFGDAVAGAGDVNGDGFADVIVGAPQPTTSSTPGGVGQAFVFSGVDGALLLTFNGNLVASWFGGSVAGAGDVNGDGTPDLMVGARLDNNHGPNSGSVRLFSGVNGALLFTLNGDGPGDEFGRSVAGAGDVNGDGYMDVIVGAPMDDNNGVDSGSARVFGGQGPLGLFAPAFATIGSPLTFTLATLPPQPAASYVFDLSLAGSSPGLPLPAPQTGALPLNPPFLNLTFGSLLPGVFVGFTGLLDAQGQAAPSFNIPNLPALGGLTLSAAGITLDPQAPFGLGLVSNGVQTILLAGTPLSPVVTAVSPATGPISGGTPLSILGSAFAPGATVSVGGNPATSVVVVDSQTITAIAPPGALGAADLSVTNYAGPTGSLPAAITYIPDLVLASVVPQLAPPGTTITLSGDGFMPGLQLDVGGVPVVPQSVTATQVTFAMPAGVACDGPLLVINPSTQTASLPFNPSPVVVQLLGQFGPASGGGQFVLLGTNFFPGTSVTVGGIPATITSLAQTSLIVTAPPSSPGLVPISVTSPLGCPALCQVPGGCNYLYQ